MADKTRNFGLNLSLDNSFDYLDHRYKQLFDENWEIIDTKIFTPAATSVTIVDAGDHFTGQNVELALEETIIELRSHAGSGGPAHRVATATDDGFMSSVDKFKLDGIAAGGINQTTGDARYVKIDGANAMTGPLRLPGNPTNSLEATTKQYVDQSISSSAGSRLPLDGGIMNGPITLAEGDPTSDRHAVSKKYVDDVKKYADDVKKYADAIKQGLDIKDSVKLATTQNIVLAAQEPKAIIDTVATQTNDRILVKDQTNAAENGIYVVQNDGSFVRAIDADTDVKITSGMFTFVEQGNANADSGWVLRTDGTIIVGTTSLSFTQFSGAGAVTVASPLVKSGTEISLASYGTPGTYANVTVDQYGRVSAGTITVAASNVTIVDTGNLFTATHVEGALSELFTNVSSGKNSIASAITGKGVTAAGSDTFSQLSTKIGQISTGTGNAVVADVLSGKTFTNGTSTGLTGAMPNNGAVTLTPGATARTIVSGYHNGSGTVLGDANLIAGNIKSGVTIFGVLGTFSNEVTNSAASAGNILSGKAAYVNGLRISGSMANNGGVSITPTTTPRTIAAGYHDGTGSVLGDANLIAPNIKAGTSIFGVTGSLAVGKQFSTGTITIKNATQVSITGLLFIPTLLMAFQSDVDGNVTGLTVVANKTGITTTTGATIDSKISWTDSTPTNLTNTPTVTWTSSGLSFTPAVDATVNTPCTYFVFE